MHKSLIALCVASTTLVTLMTCAARRDTIVPTGVASLGSDSALVLVFFTDYRCGACSALGGSTIPALRPLIDGGRLRLVVAEIGNSAESRQIAIGARCAREFGKYW